MKRLAVLFSLLLALIFAPPPGPRLALAETAEIVITNGPKPDIFRMLEELEKRDEPPKVSCESITSDKCVPKYRFSDEVNESSADRAVKWVQAANEAGAAEILIEFNTPGGSVPDGFELARAIEESKAPVTCVVDGDALSMGFYLLQSCDYRMMTRRSKLMAHEPSLGGMFRGQPNQWQAMADMMKAERAAMAEHCAHRLKISVVDYRKKTDGGQMWFLLHDEAMKVGAIDAVASTVRSVHEQMQEREAVAYKR